MITELQLALNALCQHARLSLLNLNRNALNVVDTRKFINVFQMFVNMQSNLRKLMILNENNEHLNFVEDYLNSIYEDVYEKCITAMSIKLFEWLENRRVLIERQMILTCNASQLLTEKLPSVLLDYVVSFIKYDIYYTDNNVFTHSLFYSNERFLTDSIITTRELLLNDSDETVDVYGRALKIVL